MVSCPYAGIQALACVPPPITIPPDQFDLLSRQTGQTGRYHGENQALGSAQALEGAKGFAKRFATGRPADAVTSSSSGRPSLPTSDVAAS